MRLCVAYCFATLKTPEEDLSILANTTQLVKQHTCTSIYQLKKSPCILTILKHKWLSGTYYQTNQTLSTEHHLPWIRSACAINAFFGLITLEMEMEIWWAVMVGYIADCGEWETNSQEKPKCPWWDQGWIKSHLSEGNSVGWWGRGIFSPFMQVEPETELRQRVEEWMASRMSSSWRSNPKNRFLQVEVARFKEQGGRSTLWNQKD